MRSRSLAWSPARPQSFWSTGNSDLASANLFIGLQRPLAALAVIDDRLRIGFAERHAGSGQLKRCGLPRLMNELFWHLGQLGHPSPHIVTVGIEFFALKYGIEDAEV